MYSKTLSLRFPKKVVTEPIVVNLVKRFDLTFNILKATVYPRKEGLMVLELSGHRKNFQRGVRYLKGLGIKVESIGQDVRRDEEHKILGREDSQFYHKTWYTIKRDRKDLKCYR